MPHIVHQFAHQVPPQAADSPVGPLRGQVRGGRRFRSEGRAFIRHRQGEGAGLDPGAQLERPGMVGRVGVIDDVDQHLLGGQPYIMLAFLVGARVPRGPRGHIEQFAQRIQARRAADHADEGHVATWGARTLEAESA